MTTPLPKPLYCPKCGKAGPQPASSFPVDGSNVSVYRCECGYLFQLIELPAAK